MPTQEERDAAVIFLLSATIQEKDELIKQKDDLASEADAREKDLHSKLAEADTRERDLHAKLADAEKRLLQLGTRAADAERQKDALRTENNAAMRDFLAKLADAEQQKRAAAKQKDVAVAEAQELREKLAVALEEKKELDAQTTAKVEGLEEKKDAVVVQLVDALERETELRKNAKATETSMRAKQTDRGQALDQNDSLHGNLSLREAFRTLARASEERLDPTNHRLLKSMLQPGHTVWQVFTLDIVGSKRSEGIWWDLSLTKEDDHLVLRLLNYNSKKVRASIKCELLGVRSELNGAVFSAKWGSYVNVPLMPMKECLRRMTGQRSFEVRAKMVVHGSRDADGSSGSSGFEEEH